MKIQDRVVVVTGGANGIGRALCRGFAAEGARGVVVADLDGEAASAVAEEFGGLPVKVDVAIEADVIELVDQAIALYGQITLFLSNAGIGGIPGGVDIPNEFWERIWQVNVMAHIYAARAVLPGMLARGDGYLLQTASAAGLLTQIGAAPYAVTKHGAVAFAEWLSMTYGEAGIRVSCLCPQGVRTKMLLGEDGKRESFLLEGSLEPEQVAEAVI